MLVGIDDVETGLGKEAADRGDQPRPVGTGKQQPRCRVLGDSPIIAARAARALSSFVRQGSCRA
jgi:hypothetical protein